LNPPVRGEVWIVDLGLAAKVRPAVVLSVPPSETERALVTLVPHTTSLRGSRFEVATRVPFLKEGAFDAQGQLISVFAGPIVDRSFRCLALIAATALGACTHVGRPRILTTNDQLVASALSWAVRVPPRASEYRIEVPAAYPRDAILAAAAAETKLIRRGAALRRRGEKGFREPVRITVQMPQHATAQAAQQEFRVPFTVAVGGAKPIDCVVRIRLPSDDPRSWIYAAEGEEHCWPRPGALTSP
jgi:mRNA interferase MazF